MSEVVGSLKKTQSERIQRTIDVTNSLPSGQTLSSGAVKLYDIGRKEVSAYVSTGTVSGSKIISSILPGSPSLGLGRYTWRFLATLSNQEVLAFDIHVRILPD